MFDRHFGFLDLASVWSRQNLDSGPASVTQILNLVEYSQLLLVLLVVTTSLGAAFIVLLRWLLRRWHRSRLRDFAPDLREAYEQLRTVTRARRWCERGVFTVGSLALGGVGWGLVEPRWLETTLHDVPSNKLEHGTRIRVVQLSDLHSEAQLYAEPAMVSEVAALKPDVIVFTGDAVNGEAGLGTFRATMAQLAGIAPTFSVRGNWETWWFPHLDLYVGTSVQPVDGRAHSITIRGQKIWLVGVGVDHEDRLLPAMATVPTGSFTILLHHFPALAPRAAKLGIDLMLAGDTHGGQARLPFMGELVRIKRRGIWRSAGMHREGSMWLYVNRGIGGEGGIPRFRFACRPEITVVDVRGVQ